MKKLFDPDTMILIIGGGLASYRKWLITNPKDTFIPPSDDEVIQDYLHNPLFNKMVDRIIKNIENHITNHST